MSPEQLRGGVVDARTDLFSLGLVLYEMATGQRAFGGKTGAEVSAAILHEKPARPKSLRPEIPDKLEDIILKALEKDRDLRYQSAADLRGDLKRMKREVAEPSDARDQRDAFGGTHPPHRLPAPTRRSPSDWCAGTPSPSAVSPWRSSRRPSRRGGQPVVTPRPPRDASRNLAGGADDRRPCGARDHLAGRPLHRLRAA